MDVYRFCTSMFLSTTNGEPYTHPFHPSNHTLGHICPFQDGRIYPKLLTPHNLLQHT
jgi:hypothetical protein